ncbi:MAG: hypothetical protein WCN95_16780, partial [bacterium]
PTQEWSDLTNNLWQCYSGIVLRCQAANISTNDFAPPTNCWPMYEYTRFAAKLSEICTKFACQANANTNGNFNGLTSTDLNTPENDFPMWTTSNLFRYCQITNSFGEYDWNTNMPVHSWETVSHLIQTQVVSVLTTLVWTARHGDWTSSGITNYNNTRTRDYVASYDTLLTNAQTAFTSHVTALYIDELVYVSTNKEEPKSWYFYWYDNGKRVRIRRGRSKLAVDNVWSNTAITADVEFYGFPTARNEVGMTNIWDTQDDVVTQNVWNLFCAMPNMIGVTNVTSTNWFGTTNVAVLPPRWTNGIQYYTEGWTCKGRQAVFKWHFPPMPSPVMYPNHPCPDLDRDDLVDIGIDTERFGPDTGAIVFRADQDQPYVVLPLASPPVWYGGLHPKAYLSQGGTTNLPYHYLVPPLADNDGW